MITQKPIVDSRPPTNFVANSRKPDTKTVTLNQALLLAASALRLIISFAITVYLGRILDPPDYGFFVMVNTILLVCRELLDLGMSNIAAREIVLAPDKERQIIENLMGWQRIVGLILAFCIVIFGSYQNDPNHLYSLFLAALVVFFMYNNALYPCFQVRQSLRGPVLLSIATQSLVLFGIFSLESFAAYGALFPLLIITRECLNIICIRRMAKTILGFIPVPVIQWGKMKPFIDRALTFALAALAHNISFYSGMFWIWGMGSKGEMGAYAAAFSPIAPLFSLPWILLVPLVPVLTWAFRYEKRAFRKLAGDLCLLAAGIGATMAVTGNLLSQSILNLLFGTKYLAGELSTTTVFQFLSLAIFFGCITPVAAIAMLAGGNEKKLLQLSLVGLVFNFSGNVLLIPRYGTQSVAIVTLMTELIVCLGGLMMLRETLRSSFVLLRIIAFFLPAAGTAAILQFIPDRDNLQLTAGVFCAVLSIILLISSPVARQHRLDLSVLKQSI